MQNVVIHHDTFGELAQFTLDCSVYSLDAIKRALYWYTETCYTQIQWADDARTSLLVTFRLKPTAKDKVLTDVVGNFVNDVLDQDIRLSVAAETRTVKEVIVKRAFAEALSKDEVAILQGDSSRTGGAR